MLIEINDNIYDTILHAIAKLFTHNDYDEHITEKVYLLLKKVPNLANMLIFMHIITLVGMVPIKVPKNMVLHSSYWDFIFSLDSDIDEIDFDIKLNEFLLHNE